MNAQDDHWIQTTECLIPKEQAKFVSEIAALACSYLSTADPYGELANAAMRARQSKESMHSTQHTREDKNHVSQTSNRPPISKGT